METRGILRLIAIGLSSCSSAASSGPQAAPDAGPPSCTVSAECIGGQACISGMCRGSRPSGPGSHTSGVLFHDRTSHIGDRTSWSLHRALVKPAGPRVSYLDGEGPVVVFVAPPLVPTRDDKLSPIPVPTDLASRHSKVVVVHPGHVEVLDVPGFAISGRATLSGLYVVVWIPDGTGMSGALELRELNSGKTLGSASKSQCAGAMGFSDISGDATRAVLGGDFADTKCALRAAQQGSTWSFSGAAPGTETRVAQIAGLAGFLTTELAGSDCVTTSDAPGFPPLGTVAAVVQAGSVQTAFGVRKVDDGSGTMVSHVGVVDLTAGVFSDYGSATDHCGDNYAESFAPIRLADGWAIPVSPVSDQDAQLEIRRQPPAAAILAKTPGPLGKGVNYEFGSWSVWVSFTGKEVSFLSLFTDVGGDVRLFIQEDPVPLARSENLASPSKTTLRDARKSGRARGSDTRGRVAET
jgi:hypothetical protein